MQAVVCLRGLRILHRDLKPRNVLFMRDGSAKVVDFDFSEQLGAGR